MSRTTIRKSNGAARPRLDRRGSLFGTLVVTHEAAEKQALDIIIANYQEELLDPTLENPSAVHNNVANSMMKRGLIMDAIKHYRQALELTASHDPAVLMNMGLAFKHLHNYDEAVTYFRMALEIRPSADEHYNLANTLMKIDAGEKVNEAVIEYKECLKMDPNHANAHMNLGTALKESGHLEGAIVEFRCALKLLVRDFNTHYNLANALVAKATVDEAKGVPQAKIDGSLQEAVDQYEQAIQLSPKDADVRTNLAIVLQRMRRAGEAVAHYLEVMNLQPGDYETHYNTGNALWAMEPPNLVGAVEQYKEALVLNGEHPETMFNLANALMQMEEWGEACATFEMYVEMTGEGGGITPEEEALIYYNVGGCYGKMDQNERSKEALEKSIAVHGSNDQAYLNLGNLLVTMKDSDTAIDMYKQAISLNKDNVNAHRNLAFTLVEEGDLEEGGEWLKKVLAMMPDDEEAQMYMADIDRMINENEKLSRDIEEARKVVSENETNLGARAKLAQLLRADDQLEESAKEFEKCLEQQPGHPKLTVMLEGVQRELGLRGLSPPKLEITTSGNSLANGSSKFFDEANSPTGRERSHSSMGGGNGEEAKGGFSMFGGKKKGRTLSTGVGKDTLKKKSSARKMSSPAKVGVSG